MENVINYMNTCETKIMNKCSNFLDVHWYFSMKMSLIVAIWLVLSISVISMAGIVGMDQMKKNNEINYASGQMPEKDYQFWQTFVNPIFDLILLTMKILTYIVMLLAVYFGVYRPIKKIISIKH